MGEMAKATDQKKELERILSRSYTHELVRDKDGSWFARVLELPGCMTTGRTEADALANLHDAMKAWVTAALEIGDSVPEPASVDQYSGKFMVRLPRSLHRDLVRRADVEGVSLNALVTTSLAAAIAGRGVEGMAQTVSLLKAQTVSKRKR
jgi:antitoxin HicB